MTKIETRVGYIGVGLMGHGAAKNILGAGYPLTILAHRNREPVDDLVRRGAHEAHDPRELAQRSDVVFTCLPTAVEVGAILFGPHGVAEGLAENAVVVDSTTSDPAMTRQYGERLASRGIGMLDAPLGRTPKEAELGKLSTYVGGEEGLVERVRPILEAYTDTIIHTGPLGTGTTCKLVNNFISIGTSALISEAIVAAHKMGLDLAKLYDVISAGGANSAMFQMMMPWVLQGDSSALKGPVRIAAKDLRTYMRMVEGAKASAFVASSCSQLWNLAEARGYAESFMPTLPEILAEIQNDHIRDLD